MYDPDFIVRKNYYGFVFENRFVYEIDKKRCRNERELNEWIAHMEEKVWWNKDLERKLINAYKKENGLNNA